MTRAEIPAQRLRNQRLSSRALTRVVDVVTWFGAVQAQDYSGAKWALGQRMRSATDRDIDAACDEGAILRTHVMRPTWHFVAPEDIRWMLALTAPRVNAAMASYYRTLALDGPVFTRTHKALARALRNGRHLTRQALREPIERAGVATGGLRLVFILLRAELDGVICSGPREDKQQTYALLADRVPQTKAMPRDEALGELTRRYFTSHGPATIRDFTWWSGLTVADAKRGLDIARDRLVQETVDGIGYWGPSSKPPVRRSSPRAWLLPNYDEYLVAYKDRSAVLESAEDGKGMNALAASPLVINGRMAGTWKRTLTRGAMTVTITTRRALTKPEREAVADATERYGAFLGIDAVVR